VSPPREPLSWPDTVAIVAVLMAIVAVVYIVVG
jgi:hypothetical protein